VVKNGKMYRIFLSGRVGLKGKLISLRHFKLLLVALVPGGLILYPVMAHATTLISQAYFSDATLPTGAIVSLQKNSSDHVESATTDNTNNLLGVIVDGDNSEISISSDKGNQVHVATNGVEPVLVSDINGNIAVGDPITASPVKGVGMKATGNVKIVGVAQAAFPNATASKQSYKDQHGAQQSLQLGQVQVQVNVAYYFKQPDKTIIPASLQSVVDALAGKKVNTLPILISIGIFFITLVIVVSIVYSMIHGSIISVGRNPLSQAAVYRNVIHLSALVVLILGVALGAIYMVLAKF
jgi:hypothetical protein